MKNSILKTTYDFISNRIINFSKSKQKLKKIKEFSRTRIFLRNTFSELQKACLKKNINCTNTKRTNIYTSFFKSILVNYEDLNVFTGLYGEIFNDQAYKFKSNKSNPFIIDCGGNIGMATLYFKSIYPNSKILAIEPLKENCELFQKNIEINNLKNVTILQKAAFNKRTKISLNNAGPGGASITYKWYDDAKKTESVETILLSDLINEEVDLLKLDPEGCETLILEELSNNNKLKFIKQIVMEYHHMPNNPENNFMKILGILHDNGFDTVDIKTFGTIKTNNKEKFVWAIVHAQQKTCFS